MIGEASGSVDNDFGVKSVEHKLTCLTPLRIYTLFYRTVLPHIRELGEVGSMAQIRIVLGCVEMIGETISRPMN